MNAKPYLMGIDQGTSGSRAVVMDRAGQIVGYAYRPVARIYPQPSWVEQNPTALAHGVAETMAEAVAGQASPQTRSWPAASPASATPTSPGMPSPGRRWPIRSPGRICARCPCWPSWTAGSWRLSAAEPWVISPDPTVPPCIWRGACKTCLRCASGRGQPATLWPLGGLAACRTRPARRPSDGLLPGSGDGPVRLSPAALLA